MDNTYSTYRDGKYIIVPPIDDLCLALKDKFLRQEEQNNYLKEENKRLKDEHYKDEEIKKLQEKIQELESRRSFVISKEAQERINNWLKDRKRVYTGAIGGRYEYHFLPTGIGTVGKIVDTLTKEEFIFQDLD